MNAKLRNIIVVILVFIAIVAVGYGIYTSMTPVQIEPYGPMTGGDENVDPNDPMMPPRSEAIPWDEVIYVPIYKECIGERMVFTDDVIKIERGNETIYHWLYTCEKAEMNRTNIKVDATRMPDYELPS